MIAPVGEPIRFHDTRHTHVALAIKQGVHPALIASRPGHKSVKTVLDERFRKPGVSSSVLDGHTPSHEADHQFVEPGETTLMFSGSTEVRKAVLIRTVRWS